MSLCSAILSFLVPYLKIKKRIYNHVFSTATLCFLVPFPSSIHTPVSCFLVPFPTLIHTHVSPAIILCFLDPFPSSIHAHVFSAVILCCLESFSFIDLHTCPPSCSDPLLSHLCYYSAVLPDETLLTQSSSLSHSCPSCCNASRLFIFLH